MLSTIEKKKRGLALSQSAIESWITGAVNGSIPDYQSAALLMAIRLNGMTPEETSFLTMAMLESGDRIGFHGYEKILDKHSTGGVGDKVTLVLAPLMAACGVPVAMLSGRGLGFSGGTIDKFESVEGVNCSLSESRMQDVLDQIGWTNSMPTRSLVPADRLLYGLRDVTATVDSIPLITASIMSKKIAGGASHLCLDVKAGSAAFMPDREQALALYHSLKVNGELCGLKIRGIISRMEEPLGMTIGNYLEMIESVNMLRDWEDSPLMQLIADLGMIMIRMKDPVSEQEAVAMMKNKINDGSALEKFYAYLSLCGGKADAIEKLDKASYNYVPSLEVVAGETGLLTGLSGRRLAEVARDLGAGRKQTSDVINPDAGIRLLVHIGDRIEKGQKIAQLFGAFQSDDTLIPRTLQAFSITEDDGHSLLTSPQDSLTIQFLD
jgi:pyrimidine-nucleoside phosphorylase